MKCPSCGADNEPEALCCTICTLVLKKEAPAAPPPPKPGDLPPEPANLDRGEDINQLLILALKMGFHDRFDESERLMSRLYQEVEPETCQALIAACGQEWLKVTELPPNERSAAQALIVTIAASVGQGALDQAVNMSRALIDAIKAPTAEGSRLQLLLLGVKGAAKRGGWAAEPKVLDSIESWRKMIALAQRRALASDEKEVLRLMTRLFTEIALNDCERLIVTGGGLWLESAKLPPEKEAAARAMIMRSGRSAAAGDFRAAHAVFRDLLPLIKPEAGAPMRLMLFALGLQGAAAAKDR